MDLYTAAVWLADGSPCQSEYHQSETKLSGIAGTDNVVQPPVAGIRANKKEALS
jgi:hypothetical protein